MLQNLQPAKSQFQNILHDLRAMIFEFLPLSDFIKVQLVCRNFYYDCRENPEFWAKHLYSYFLDPTINQDFLICEDFLEEKPKNSQKGINFHSMISSRKIIETHFRLKFELKTFLNKFTPSEFSKELTQEIFNILRTPAYPTPCLKKSMQTFPTNTLFQNFLTEVHFGLQGKPQFKDRRHLMVEEVMNQIKSVMFSGGMDEEKLISLRWYLFEKDNTIKRNAEVSNAHLVGAKRISKVKNVLRNGKLHTYVDHCENFIQTHKNKHKAFGARGIKIKGLFRSDAKSFGLGNNTEIDTVECGTYGCEEYQHLIEDFYQLIYSLFKNHCQMIFMYLKTIQEAELLLNEYIRLWGDFVLMMIDLNKTLAPFSEFLNDVYNRNCQSLPNFPEFSIWRVMIKVWLNDVYGPMSASFHTAFLYILANVRIQDSQIKFNIMQLEKDLIHDQIKREDTAFSSRNMLFNRFNEVLQINTDEQARDQSLTVLKQFYQVICDLSYDEYTIFYSACVPTKSETPKGALDILIRNETQQLYEYCKQILLVDPSYLTSFFKEDVELMDALFGKEMGCLTKEKQIPMFESYLSEIFYSAVKDYEETLLRSNPMQTEEEHTRVSDMIISSIITLVKPQEEVRKKICENRNYKEAVAKIVSRRCPMVTSFVHFLSDLKNGLEYQYRQFEEAINERYMRGFTLIDDKYEGLFTLNRNPSCRSIKNLREEGNCGQSSGSTKESVEHVF